MDVQDYSLPAPRKMGVQDYSPEKDGCPGFQRKMGVQDFRERWVSRISQDFSRISRITPGLLPQDYFQDGPGWDERGGSLRIQGDPKNQRPAEVQSLN